MVQGNNRRRHTDHPTGHHSIQTNQCLHSPSPIFLRAGCPSCHPTNSVKALKAVSLSPVILFQPYSFQSIVTCMPQFTRLLNCWIIWQFGPFRHHFFLDVDAYGRVFYVRLSEEFWTAFRRRFVVSSSSLVVSETCFYPACRRRSAFDD